MSVITAPHQQNAPEEQVSGLPQGNLPQHLAVIMDGNRRWAKLRRLPSVLGHQAGVRSFRRMLEACRELGIPYLTAYAFSAENWRRSPVEVGILMQLFERYAAREREKLRRTGIRFCLIGNVDDLPEQVRREFLLTVEATKDNSAMVLNLAVNYGSREEIVRAVRSIAGKVQEGSLTPEAVTADLITGHLYTAGQPDPDLLIRTSGELRMSNFLLWQSAYTEFFFTDAFWPDVDRTVLDQALSAFARRERRYGGGESA